MKWYSRNDSHDQIMLKGIASLAFHGPGDANDANVVRQN